MTEKYSFHRLFNTEKYEELEWLNIYNADGVQNIPQALNYLGSKNLNLSGIAILDSDQEARNIQKGKKAQGYIKTIDNKSWFSIEINDVFTRVRREFNLSNVFF